MAQFTIENISNRKGLEKVVITSCVGGFAECFVVERISDKKKYALKIISKKLL